MDKYVYRVVSNKPLSIGVGMGNMHSITHSEQGYNMTRRDAPAWAESCGAAASVGLFVSMELIEKEEK